MKTLNQLLDAEWKQNGPSFFREKVPQFIYANLKPGFGKRPYQQEAFGRFIYYYEEYRNKPADQPLQLLYHMATGSGKTVVMAGLMIYLYNKGYRNFLFFVNSANIIEKTKANFTQPSSSKYLFAETVAVGGKKLHIRVAENFEGSGEEDLTIVFTTIQGLHARLNTPRENAVTDEDFTAGKMVLISDEAHHINAETKRGVALDKEEKETLLSWERTVNKLFRANKENLLLEFTATLDLTLPEITRKYADKLLFDYPLKQFRKDGYSKEVKLLQADLPLFERALQALILSQYRQKLFEKHGLRIKPVILFKSKTIRESEVFHTAFVQALKTLDGQQLQALREGAIGPAANSGNVLQKAFSFFEEKGVAPENLALELKEDFKAENCLVVNSKEESEQKTMAVNTLEDEDNRYRAVFAVDKLNEGWDVLNLFDIVRLYDTRDANGSRPGKTTMSEAQLIGRGARYCPFRTAETQTADRRKFDDEPENEERICEELYYHSAYNVRYIQELHTALVEIGLKPALWKQCSINVKASFKALPFYRQGLVFLNERMPCDKISPSGFENTIIHRLYTVRLRTGNLQTTAAFDRITDHAAAERNVPVKKIYGLPELGVHVVRKALARLPFYRFSNLKKQWPHLSSLTEFMTSERYLGAIRVEVAGTREQIEKLPAEEKLQTAVEVLQKIEPLLTTRTEYRGTKSFRPFRLNEIMKDKTLTFPLGEGSEKEWGKPITDPLETALYLDLAKKEWYAGEDCFGTSEEKQFLHYFDELYSRLKQNFDEVYLVKNERFFRFYHFDDGRAEEPQFVLFLLKTDLAQTQYFQYFIKLHGEDDPGKKERPESFLPAKDGSRIEPLWNEGTYWVGWLFFRNDDDGRSAFRKKLFDEAPQRPIR